jgi:hypothetical protein
MLGQDQGEVAVVVNHYHQEVEDYPVAVEILVAGEEQGLLDRVED